MQRWQQEARPEVRQRWVRQRHEMCRSCPGAHSNSMGFPPVHAEQPARLAQPRQQSSAPIAAVTGWPPGLAKSPPCRERTQHSTGSGSKIRAEGPTGGKESKCRAEYFQKVHCMPAAYHILHTEFCSAYAVGCRRDAAAGCYKAPAAASRACCRQAQACAQVKRHYATQSGCRRASLREPTRELVPPRPWGHSTAGMQEACAAPASLSSRRAAAAAPAGQSSRWLRQAPKLLVNAAKRISCGVKPTLQRAEQDPTSPRWSPSSPWPHQA